MQMSDTIASSRPQHIIVMGVSGCGKSTLAAAIAKQLGWPMLEGDEFHPAANLEKMSRGEALNDTDRAPWLTQLNTKLKERSRLVLSCSALKTAYRQTLTQSLAIAPLFVHVHGSYEQLHERLQLRAGHFMPASLLGSQFAALEMPCETGIRCVTVSTESTTAAQLIEVLAFLSRQ